MSKKNKVISVIIICIMGYFYFASSQEDLTETFEVNKPLTTTLPKTTYQKPLPTLPTEANPSKPVEVDEKNQGPIAAISDTAEKTFNSDEELEKYKFLQPSEINETLKRAKVLKKMKAEVIEIPACYLGEYYPYPGKADRHEVELFISATPDESGEINASGWWINKKSQFTVFSLGAPIKKGEPDIFKSPDSDIKSDVGLLVVFESEIYQIFKIKGQRNLKVKFFQRQNSDWMEGSEFKMNLYDGSAQDCYFHKQVP